MIFEDTKMFNFFLFNCENCCQHCYESQGRDKVHCFHDKRPITTEFPSSIRFCWWFSVKVMREGEGDTSDGIWRELIIIYSHFRRRNANNEKEITAKINVTRELWCVPHFSNRLEKDFCLILFF